MTRQTCPVCEGARVSAFLRRSQVPVHQNLVVTSREAACAVARGELDVVVCNDCGFVFNRSFDLAKLAYGQDYDNTQSCSGHFDAYLDGLVTKMVEGEGLNHHTIVEVGCGKGDFLRKLVTFPGADNRGYGFDPSYVGPEIDQDGRLVFRRCYYDDTCADVAADVVVCRHVIEHVPEPMRLLRSIRAALTHSPHARVFFETPCVEWILRHRVVWDFFYEHCSLFTADSLGLAFERSGFSVQRVDHIFGGQYLWLEARVADQACQSSPAHIQTPALAANYSLSEGQLQRDWLTRLGDLRAKGRVALWGAGAKGATFANLVDPGATLIDCVVDLNPNKQGRFVPGTGHPIVSPADLPGRAVRSAILMNPNYREENLQLLARSRIDVDLIDWSER